MIGVQLSIDGTAIVQACLEKQLLVNCISNSPKLKQTKYLAMLLPPIDVVFQVLQTQCDYTSFASWVVFILAT